ncbi:MAG TPA: MotA/TolQ/ExbB proton channel family protein [Bacteroidia bacterium]|nr:MotA/TolQ/ExbB proton channel family protein [Bacteroidia bacterium]HRU66963.1 MotA/TolQ/ExbB proton channel family protein [Bacteroidia bacterium]
MKKVLLSLTLLGMVFYFGASYAQDAKKETDKKEAAKKEAVQENDAQTPADTQVAAQTPAEPANMEGGEEPVVKRSGKQMIKKFFIDGGQWMFPILLCFIIGLAVVIEKIISLNLKSVNTKKLLGKIEDYFKKNDIQGAEELCRNTRGSVASIFYQAISRRKEGVDGVEKSIVSYGSVQMAMLEKGLIWISLFIAIAPMLGFLGTVVGMVGAFDAIEQAGTISPSLVAGGIKVALITTVGGLIVAIILQLFYNYLVSKIDGIVSDMEDSSISLVDMMIEYGVTEKK